MWNLQHKTICSSDTSAHTQSKFGFSIASIFDLNLFEQNSKQAAQSRLVCSATDTPSDTPLILH